MNKWHLQTGENTDHENASAVEPSHVTGVVEQNNANYAKVKSTLDRIAKTIKELSEKQ